MMMYITVDSSNYWSQLRSTPGAQTCGADVAALAQAHDLGKLLPGRCYLRHHCPLPPPPCVSRAVGQQAQPPQEEPEVLLYLREGQLAAHEAGEAGHLGGPLLASLTRLYRPGFMSATSSLALAIFCTQGWTSWLASPHAAKTQPLTRKYMNYSKDYEFFYVPLLFYTSKKKSSKYHKYQCTRILEQSANCQSYPNQRLSN